MHQDKIWDYYQNEGLESGGFSDARQRFMLRYLDSGSSVLNIGVGSGALERLALSKQINIYSLDPSSSAITQLQEKLGFGERAKTGYAQDIPFDDKKFDAVVMSEVLEHLEDENLDNALREVIRVLKPGGLLVLSTPFNETLESQNVVCPECGKVFHKWGHVQSFDMERMNSLLFKHGFITNRIFITTFVDWHRKGMMNLVKSIVRIMLAKLRQSVADPHLIAITKKKTS